MPCQASRALQKKSGSNSALTKGWCSSVAPSAANASSSTSRQKTHASALTFRYLCEYEDRLWVSGALKGHGYAGELLAECIRDARAQGRKGLCILCAEGRKREFLADPKFLEHEGFTVADVSDCGITLMMLPLDRVEEKPKFKECARHPKAAESGFVLYYTDQCPFTYYWVPKVEATAKEHGIPLKTIRITNREAAQNVPAPVTTYALFRDGKFVTQSIQSDKKFLALAGVKL